MKSPVTLYRYGSPRSRDELVRIGVARQVPRGVKCEDRQRLGYFDVHLPLLAPSAPLIKAFRGGEIPFETFERRYRKEMEAPEPRQVIELLAAMIAFEPVSLGCFCEDETRCHRMLLRSLIEERAKARGAAFPREAGETGQESPHFASPVCYANYECEERDESDVQGK